MAMQKDPGQDDPMLYCDACERIFAIHWRELRNNPLPVTCPTCQREGHVKLLPGGRVGIEHREGVPDHIHVCNMQRLNNNLPMKAIVISGLALTVWSAIVAPLLLCPLMLMASLLLLLLYIVI